MNAPAPEGFDPAEVLAEIGALRQELFESADAILFAAETGLQRLSAHRRGDAAALGDIERLLCAVLGACAFQDLTGQRLDKIERRLAGERSGPNDLLHGPALRGEGLDQAAADALFADEPCPGGA